MLALVVVATLVALVALAVACQALALVAHGARRNAEKEDLPSSTFLLTSDQREALAPEVQARVFQEETLARIAKRR